jgi:hypothetical protein
MLIDCPRGRSSWWPNRSIELRPMNEHWTDMASLRDVCCEEVSVGFLAHKLRFPIRSVSVYRVNSASIQSLLFPRLLRCTNYIVWREEEVSSFPYLFHRLSSPIGLLLLKRSSNTRLRARCPWFWARQLHGAASSTLGAIIVTLSLRYGDVDNSAIAIKRSYFYAQTRSWG